MKQSGYLAKLGRAESERVATMRRITQQILLDTLMITMHEDFGWGYDRLKKLEGKWSETVESYLPALTGGMESDVYQERLDRALRSCIGDKQDFIDFKERYPEIRQIGYEPKRRK